MPRLPSNSYIQICAMEYKSVTRSDFVHQRKEKNRLYSRRVICCVYACVVRCFHEYCLDSKAYYSSKKEWAENKDLHWLGRSIWGKGGVSSDFLYSVGNRFFFCFSFFVCGSTTLTQNEFGVFNPVVHTVMEFNGSNCNGSLSLVLSCAQDVLSAGRSRTRTPEGSQFESP